MTVFSPWLARHLCRVARPVRWRVNCLSSVSSPPFSVVSFYHLKKVDRVGEVVDSVGEWLEGVGAKGRIYFNSQGVNCQMCLKSDKVDKMKEVMGNSLGIEQEELRLKIHPADFNVFRRLRVRHGKLLENLSEDTEISERGQHLDRLEWNKILDEEPDSLVLDIRNGYEWDVGRFKGAERPQFSKFSEFGDMVEEVVESVKDKEQKVLLYCTGGIRCEVFSSMLLKRGLQQVYQLQDGVALFG